VVVEIALSLEELSGRRKKQGDIIEARAPSLGLGRMEMTRYVWLWVEVPEAAAAVLTQGTEELKRRYYIPLNRLRQAWQLAGGATIDLSRLLDPNDPYQPCLPVDPATGLFLPGQQLVLSGNRLIYDRVTGKVMAL
jgi:hypothetical protein